MDDTAQFEDEPSPSGKSDAEFILDLEGYEGPIDALLQLARDQKVDLTRISILALADQYLAFVSRARRLRLEFAADYLVMAAWLAYLKSRLLLPEPSGDDEPSGAEMAAALRFQLQRLQAFQDAGGRLMARPRLGRDVFGRGEPVMLKVVNRTSYEANLYDLLSAYGHIRGQSNDPQLLIDANELYSVDDALGRMTRLLGSAPGWRTLTSFLPPEQRGGLHWRSAVASTLAAALEMSRQGRVEVRQDGPFHPIYVRGRAEQTPERS